MHISCSTVSPTIARKLQTLHHAEKMEFISSPVFARPDGISRREATFMLSGNAHGKEIAKKYLELLGRTEDISEEIGAANVGQPLRLLRRNPRFRNWVHNRY